MRKQLALMGALLIGLHLLLMQWAPALRSLPMMQWLSRDELLEACLSLELGRPEAAASPAPSAVPTVSPAPSPTPSPEPTEAPEVLAETMAGAIDVQNSSGYEIDVAALLTEGPGLQLQKDRPQILIIHTHSSEAYTPDDFDFYEASDNSRTQDPKFNIIRVGDALTEALRGYGLEVIHDREIYDYPSYTGSYTRSGEAIEQYLAKYPELAMVIDVHRDAIYQGDVVYKTVAEGQGDPCAQTMLVMGSSGSGLHHPDWRENLKLALYLQSAIYQKTPSLLRPIKLVPERYNQHLTHGSMILEVGSNGNTLQEALNAVELFAQGAGPALADLVR